MTGDRLLVETAAVAAAERQVEIAFAGAAGTRTYLRRQRVAYPFHVGRALYLPGDPAEFCTVYLQSCSGGLFQKDRLGIALTVASGARAHVTTAASTVVHSMPDGHAEQHVLIRADRDALVEYLPDPLILFPDSRLRNTLTVRAHRESTVMVCDAFLSHDPEAKRRPFGWLRTETRIADEGGRLLAVDRFAIEGRQLLEPREGIHGPHTIQASLMVIHRADPAAALEALRSALPADGPVYAGASLLPGDAGAWVRLLSADAVALRQTLKDAWSAARERFTGAKPGTRRK
ncbi:MAG: urease accessory protein UreD [Betaproteobacteria bacterium]|nr:urease accessory protein UreD [Betaproteobacteria bacterium]